MSLINEALKKAAREGTPDDPLENALPDKIVFNSSKRAGGRRPPLALIIAVAFTAGMAVLLQVPTVREWVSQLTGGPPPPPVAVAPTPSPVKTAVAPKPAPVDKAVVAKQLTEAATTYQNGDYKNAKTLFAEVVGMAPSSAVARNGLGLVEKALGNTDQAERHYTEAIRLDNAYAEAHNNLALLYDQRDQTERAIVEYTTTLALRPDYPEARLNYAIALERMGRLDDAKKEYRQFMTTAPSS
jgi:Tfp pilus assembly protein PilF